MKYQTGDHLRVLDVGVNNADWWDSVEGRYWMRDIIRFGVWVKEETTIPEYKHRFSRNRGLHISVNLPSNDGRKLDAWMHLIKPKVELWESKCQK